MSPHLYLLKCRPTRHRDRHGRAHEAFWYGRPPRSTDAKCGRLMLNAAAAPITLRKTRHPPGHRRNDIILRSDASEDSSLTGLTILTRT
ncbi:hypothetical protein EVAR_39793_1 [Eumeta japonica]|uniref:Uncharacterized protein n=1 Tax=Eumeta variegata TaxID=151549 RepID=A0A4C1X2W8_EUMVA|nr:hypothetical protein EVAR_39793_1 [Eumeta japonica]